MIRVLKSPITFCFLIFTAGALFWLYDFNANSTALYPLSEPRATSYVKSGECKACHNQHYESWQKTYHRTMTAPAIPEFVKAPIEKSILLNFYGYDVKFERIQDKYFVELPYFDGSYRRFPILYTIGSRRMQQFAIQDGGRIYRVPVFYSIERKEWMHINNAFFRRKGSGLSAFLQGYGIWNPNCIFCHNTRPNPNLDSASNTFHSEVAETGIACEECHGPGEVHVRVNHNPLRRYYFQYTGYEDRTIQHANKLEKTKSVQVCGQCHGQRLPQPLNRIEELMAEGDPYVPAADLFEYYKPIVSTDVIGTYDLFRLRFWKDRSPRLTAFELQGILSSKCFQMSTNMNCQSCHNNHGGDSKGMIDPEMRTNSACTKCHEKYETEQAVRSHTKHKLDSTTCYSCHMPEVVYGVMTIHPTHLIRNPDPTRTVKFNMPNECNICHLDKSVNWSITEFRRLWNRELTEGDSTFDLPEIIRGFASGDAVYRVNLLYHARKSRLKNFEDIYRAGLNDEFYIVNTFAMDALEQRYQKTFKTKEQWLSFLSTQRTITIIDLERLKAGTTADEPFEFGE